MNKIKYGDVLFAVLMAAALLALFLAFEYRRKAVVSLPLPAATVALPLPPPETGAEAINKKRVSGAGSIKKSAGVKPKAKRKKRVSRLRDPGEALIGGASTGTAPAANVTPAQNK